jgi:membrane protein implicated in regulation of membrane protease activity
VENVSSPPVERDGGYKMSRTLIIFGLVLLAAGIAWPFISRLGLGRLPGDIAIERPGFSFYFPLMTSLIISVVLSVIFWLVNR